MCTRLIPARLLKMVEVEVAAGMELEAEAESLGCPGLKRSAGRLLRCQLFLPAGERRGKAAKGRSLTHTLRASVQVGIFATKNLGRYLSARCSCVLRCDGLVHVPSPDACASAI